MAPIRIALIGLSSNAATGWASNAHLPYLLSAEGRAKYRIVALCNSSAEAARKAISLYKLDSDTKAYGDPADVAADPDVDMVVSVTRVDRHYDTVLASLKAGKTAFVEWPLAENATRAGELAAIARQGGLRTVVGLQGWFAPVILALRRLLVSGRLGKILTSEVRAAGGLRNLGVVPPGLKYFTERGIGGNTFTIGFGHMWDYIQFVLGDIRNVHSRLQLQQPDVKVTDPTTKKVLEVVKSDVPDLYLVTGDLTASEYVQQGASINIRYRVGQTFKGEPPMVWTIRGDKGEARLTSQSGPTVNVTAKENAPLIELHDFATDQIEQIGYDSDARLGLGVPARNIGAVYEAFANGDAGYPTFEHAHKRHIELDKMLAEYEEQQKL